MFLHYLLVILVVLLGNLQGISVEKESFAAHKESPIGPNQAKPSKDDEDTSYKQRSQDKTNDRLPMANTIKVTDLHDPLNILERINKSDTIHSHSITSEDFAQVTSTINRTSSAPALQNHDDQEDENNLSLLIVPVQDIPVDEYKLIQNMSVNNVTSDVDLVIDNAHNVQIGSLNITEITSNSEGIINNQSSNNSEQNVLPLTLNKYTVSSNVSYEPYYKSGNFTGLVTKIKEEIKTYSNDAIIAWVDLKERISSENEVTHVLNDYQDKITISQAANRSECVKIHVEKYEKRKQFLNDIMQSCETNMKREQWHKFQNRTKEVLNSINEIVLETNMAKEDLHINVDDNVDKMSTVEREGIKKLELLRIEKEKQALSDLKKTSLSTDEDDYRDCVTRNTGHEVIVDTLNDIMKIKNNCVG